MPKYGLVETSSSSSGPVRRVMSNANFLMELFDRSGHFGMWQCEVLDALFQQGLDIAIEEEKPEYMEEKEWGIINRLACSTIRSCLSREHKYGYKNETSASKMWKTLEKKFLKKSSQNHLHMKKRLFRFDYQPDTRMNEHITAFNELVADLLGMDKTFKDEDLALMLLSSLPDKFEHLETTLLHGKDNVTFKDVTVALYSYELRKKTKKESKYEAVEAMVARGRSKSQKPKWRGRSKSKSSLGKDECAFFHEKGLWKKDCPKLKKKGKATPDACSIRLKNQDGSTRVLTDVRYVPSLKKNLISLGALEFKGSVVTMRDGVLKVTYGVLVMMKGIRKNNLYYYQGSTIIGAVAAASGGDDLDATRLWHMRLGHAGEKSLQILAKKGLLKGKAFWTEDVTYAGHLINSLPSSVIGGKTPLEVWSGKYATDYDSLHVFGSTAYYHVKESKLDPRAKKAFFMGITHGKMIPEVDAVDSSTPIEESEDEEVQTQELLETPEPLAVTRPTREICIPARFVDMVVYALPVVDDDIPITYQEAIQSLESDKWKSAMDEEMQSLQKNNTWKLAQLPKGKRAIGCKWVFAKKDGSHSKKYVRYNAYAQKEGIDYNEVFSHVVKHSSIRILLALVAQLNLELAQLDVKMAFLHGDLEEEIYMTQPEGYKDGGCEKCVCKLNKSLYGLKQSSRQWYKRFDSFMRRQKYTRSKYEHCVYLQKLKDGSFIYILLYVDDMLIASKSQKEIDKLKAQLNQEFEMKDLDEAKKILGMEISRDRQRGKLCLTQKQYLRNVLQCFGMNENTKHVSIPLASQLSPKTNKEREYMAKVPYANAVGSLMYAMVCMRPEISQVVRVVSIYMHDPGEGHWQAVKWILRYLQQTVDIGLVFEQDEALGQCVVGYADSDYAGDLDKHRSTIGYLFTLAKASVSCKSTLQSTVALSTTEAEYMAVSEAVNEAIWLNGLMEDLGVVQSHISLYCDSQSAIHLAKNQVYHSRTKHIDVRYHFVREIFEEEKILLQKIATSENPANIMTKVGLNIATATPAVRGNDTDQQALLQFKAKITGDQLKIMESWNSSIHFCQWRGVTCGRKHQRVTKLELPFFKLSGSLSPYIGNLSFLGELSLVGNSFYNEIPQEIGHLRRLETLDLANNSISGEIPFNLSACSKLTWVHMRGNQLTGEIPDALGLLSNLKFLVVPNNSLRGSIPPSLGNISCMEKLSLTYNSLSGIIPEALGRLTNLSFLAVAQNDISGNNPVSMFNLSNLRVFDIAGNKIQATLHCDLEIIIPYIEFFSMATNQISGQIPVSISNASNLRVLQFGHNKLSGDVPSLEKMNNIFMLTLNENHLGNGREGDLNFFCTLVNNSKLEYLHIGFNNFGGVFPGCINNFSKTLLQIDIEANKIFGRIPDAIGNLINLELLAISVNQLSGLIPFEIGRLQKLKFFYSHTNSLSGSIPHSIGNLTMLSQLYLGFNNLRGIIPSSLGKCQMLLSLDLAHNNLSGPIPGEVLGLPSLTILLDLSSNHLTGELPVEVEKLRNLGQLDVSQNKLSGLLPNNLGSCVSLEKLFLEGNLFEGSIPSSLSSLRGLEVLDVSNNNLSGEIPKFLVNLGALKYLNLSFNDFEGVLPSEGVFKNASTTFIEGNNKLCGGIPELNLSIYERAKSNINLWRKFNFAVIIPKSPKGYRWICHTEFGWFGKFWLCVQGTLEESGATIAVKVLNLLNRGASRSFLAECEALKNIRHRNLVKVLIVISGFDYKGKNFKALVYEFMQNGSLEDWLHQSITMNEPGTMRNLNFFQRVNVAIDVAHALEYLHHHCETPIIHCDLKPSNILLDEEMVGHISDFGLAKILSAERLNHPTNHSSSRGLRGTFGYAPPEYGMGNELSTKGDVYSYGILLLEIFTGKRPTDEMFKEGLNLHNFVSKTFPDRIIEIIDPILLQESMSGRTIADITLNENSLGNNSLQCLILILEIGLTCSAESSSERMGMNDVVTKLCSVRDKLLRPTRFGRGIQTPYLRCRMDELERLGLEKC
ncbi:putative LRR receptor-like serine/threonine-protein kinase [Hibiscus syriacus]|uniref:non-specific serine/threonine protein kinase n=1 Tax=Hibiscus syriacus TaxID=106335 RepID=A0A6A3BMZ9_HIBSY|nr:putative LRR receptor-like serine/threonine-protein kinase [Hibiscus syriacus]